LGFVGAFALRYVVGTAAHFIHPFDTNHGVEISGETALGRFWATNTGEVIRRWSATQAAAKENERCFE
jgi:hypothetical protein